MKHNVKKFLSLLLAFSMVLSLMSVGVFAKDADTALPTAQGSVITLNNDVTLTNTTIDLTGITKLDLSGYTLTINNSDQSLKDGIQVEESGTVISGGTYKYVGGYGSDAIFVPKGSLVVEDVTIEAAVRPGLGEYGAAIHADGAGVSAEFKSGSITLSELRYGQGVSATGGAVLTVSGGNIDVHGRDSVGAIAWGGGKLYIAGGTIKANGIQSAAVQRGANSNDGESFVSITGGEITANGTTNENAAVMAWTGPRAIEISGDAQILTEGDNAMGLFAYYGGFTITGGTYSENVYYNSNSSTASIETLLASDDYRIVEDGDLYKVVAKTYVAKIGDNKYETLEAAFAAANDGETITLLQNASGNGIVVPQGKFGTNGLTVDFNGHTYDISGRPVGSAGTETIGMQLLKNNNITFKNGKIYAESGTRGDRKLVRLIQNYSNLTLDGMELSMKGLYYDQLTMSNCNGTITIKDSTVNAPDFVCLGYSVSQACASLRAAAFCVGTFSSYPSVSVTVEGDSVINGNIKVDPSNDNATTALNLKDGTFDGMITIGDDATKTYTISITGGKFSSDPSAYVPENVTVAKVGDTYYVGDLQKAVDAASDGDTVTLMRNATIANPATKFGEGLLISKPITLDGNGKTITVTSGHVTGGDKWDQYSAASHAIEITAANTIIKDLTVDGGSNQKTRAGILVYDTTGVELSNVTVKNCCVGVNVNASEVTTTNLITENNKWLKANNDETDAQGVNVDNGSGTSHNASFALKSGYIHESRGVVVNGGSATITGGTFSAKPAASYIAAGYKAYTDTVEEGATQTYTVKAFTTPASQSDETPTVDATKTEDNSGANTVVTYTFTDSNIADEATNTTTVAVTETDNLTVADFGESALLAEAITAADDATSVDVTLSMVKEAQGTSVVTASDAPAFNAAFEIHPLATITTTTDGTTTEVSTVQLAELPEAKNVTVPATSAATTDKYATVWHYADGTDAAPTKVGSYTIDSDGNVTFPAQTFSVYTLTYSDDQSVLYDGKLSYVLTATAAEGATDTLTSGIVDADVGGIVSVDVYLKNDYTADVGITAGSFTLDIPNGLKYKTFDAEGTGTTIDGTKADTDGTIKFYRADTNTLAVSGGRTTKVGTLTFDVEAPTGTHSLKYGDVLNIGVSAGEMHVTGTTTDLAMAAATGTKVEITTQYTITWAGLYSDVNTAAANGTTTVGVNVLPTHDDPIRTGYTFAGWTPTIAKATANTTYTAQWTANEYTLTLPASGVTATIGEGTTSVDAARTNDIVKLTIAPATGYKVKSVTVAKTGGSGTVDVSGSGNSYNFTMPAYAVTVEVTYVVDAKVVFADYKYGSGSSETATKLVLVGVDESMITSGNALKLDGAAMFKTTDTNYLSVLNSNGESAAADTYAAAYVYIVPATKTIGGKTTQVNEDDIINDLSIDLGVNKAVIGNGDVNGNASVNMTDVGIVDDLVYQRISAATVQMRLEADMFTGDSADLFGSLKDIVKIIYQINNPTAEINRANEVPSTATNG